MVFQSSVSFAVGCTIEVGVHVGSGQGVPKPGAAPTLSDEVVTSEGMVVSCVVCPAGDDLPLYEITLLFPALGRNEGQEFRELVRHHESGGTSLRKPPPLGAPSLENGFESAACSLN